MWEKSVTWFRRSSVRDGKATNNELGFSTKSAFCHNLRGASNFGHPPAYLQIGTITNITMVEAAEVVLFDSGLPFTTWAVEAGGETEYERSLLADVIRKNVGTLFPKAQS